MTGVKASYLPANYTAARRALDACVRVDEVKGILDKSIAMEVYAYQAKDGELAEMAVEVRERATRRIGELMDEDRKAGKLAKGTQGSPVKGARVDEKPTLASQGVDKSLAHQMRILGALDEPSFERKVVDARASASRVYRRAVREAEIEQERALRRAQTAQGGSVADLHALIASGYRAGCIAIDPPWPFETYSGRGNSQPTDHYETMPLDAIKALPIRALAAKNLAVFCWVTWPFMPVWHEVIEAWGVHYSGLGFDWIKLNPDGEGLHTGNGYNTRQNPEPCLLAKRGEPLRLSADVHSVIMAPVGAHSEKPDEAYRRMEQLYGGPYLELFARKPRPGWRTWGDEIKRDGAGPDDAEGER
jgi:N6-adenosine-specific RNA methylase IME4